MVCEGLPPHPASAQINAPGARAGRKTRVDLPIRLAIAVAIRIDLLVHKLFLIATTELSSAREGWLRCSRHLIPAGWIGLNLS